MALFPTQASNMVYGARVSNDSKLPKFSDVFPDLIPPNELRYIDTFKRAGSLIGTPVEQGLPVLNWAGGASVHGDPAGGGAQVTAATPSTGNGAWIASGADGEILAKVKIGELVGSVGVVFRCGSTAANHWRAIINVAGATHSVSLQLRGSGQPTRTYSVNLPQNLEVGSEHRIKVEFNGPNIKATIAGVVIELSDATQQQTTNGSGVYFLNSAGVSLHRVLDFNVK